VSADRFHILVNEVLVLHLKGAMSVLERFTLRIRVYNHDSFLLAMDTYLFLILKILKHGKIRKLKLKSKLKQ
jgi:hypothetical protein